MASRDRNSQKALVPGAPDSALTCPTTNYLSKHPGSQNALPADAHIPTPQPSHLPLVVMLVLTQASVGLVAGAAIFNSLNSGLERGTNYFSALLVAWLIAGAGLTSSFFHLGQPLRAWRAFLGLRTSWLSREIVLFGGYMMILTAALSLSLLSVYSETAEKFSSPLIWTAAICGVIAVFSSAMIYVKTGREGWRASVTFPKFFLTTASFLVFGLLVFEPSSPGPLISLIALGMFGLATESSENLSRMLFLTLGAIAIPGGLFISGAQSSGILIPAFALAAILILSGELLGRYFFFTTVNFARMPGHSGLVAVERPFRPGHFSK